MTVPRITVAVLTFNRAKLLRICLESILAQDFDYFRVVVFDNASTDDTQEVVRSFDDARVNYAGSETNIGQLMNWNRAIRENRSEFLNIFHDDDVMLPGFLRESEAMLDKYPGAGMSFCLARNVDIEGRPMGIEGMEGAPSGLMDGVEFLHTIAAGAENAIPPSGVVFRSAALEAVGYFDSAHNRFMIDRGMYFRIAREFDFAVIDKELIQLRCHAEQEREKLLAIKEYLQIAANSDRLDAIAYLLTNDRCRDPDYRRWLQERLLFWNARHSEYFHRFAPDMYWSQEERTAMLALEVEALLAEASSWILVDEDQLDSAAFAGRRVFRFIDEDGYFWGLPSDDDHAIRELERLRADGAAFIVFAWPAFWWLDHYAGLREYLQNHYPVAANSSRCIAFRLIP